jgi:hypothetical protein
MNGFKLSFLILLSVIQSSVSYRLSAPNVFRRQCSGGALTAFEGSTCAMSEANAYACSENCFDVVSRSCRIAERPLMVQSSNVVNSLRIPIHGPLLPLTRTPRILGSSWRTVVIHFVKCKEINTRVQVPFLRNRDMSLGRDGFIETAVFGSVSRSV